MSDDVETKVAAGWYVDKRWPGEQRRWDGSKWLDHWRPVPRQAGSSPESWIVIGIALAIGLGVISGLAFTIDAKYGWPALWISATVAGTVFNIGVISKAVEVGVRAARR